MFPYREHSISGNQGQSTKKLRSKLMQITRKGEQAAGQETPKGYR